GRRVDLAEAMDLHGDRRPRPLVWREPDAMLVAVHLQARRLVQRADAEPLDQLLLLERILADAEDEAAQALLRRHRVQEPALALLGRGDLDDGSLAPVGLGKVADLVDAFVEPVEDGPLPPHGPARMADAIMSVPAAAIGLPRHRRVLADLRQLAVALPPSP